MKMEINVSMEANNQKKLEYPFSNRPKDGELLNVKGGIHWLRMPLPIALNHINLWLIEGNDGFTIIDSGMSTDEAKGIWRNIFNEFVSPKKVEKILITHMHLDHSGLAGWLSSELNINPHFTQKEHNETQKIIGGMSDEQMASTDYFNKFVYLWKVRDMQQRRIEVIDGSHYPVTWKEACFYHRLDTVSLITCFIDLIFAESCNK